MKAMILAAGRGERMRPLTETTPKPLLQVGGKPLIVWHIENLVRAGFTEIVINHAHLGQMIEDALGEGNRYGARIHYSSEGEALETAGGIAKALPLLGDHPFLVVNGDIFVDYDFKWAREAAAQLPPAAAAHLVLTDNPPQHQNGDFALEAGQVRRAGHPMRTFTGIGIYRPSTFSTIVPGSKARLAPLLYNLIDQGRVRGEYFAGRWADVGTPERLTQLDQILRAEQGAAALSR